MASIVPSAIAAVNAVADAVGRPRPRIWNSFRPIVAPTDELAWEKAHAILDQTQKAMASDAGQAALKRWNGNNPENVGSVRLREVAEEGAVGVFAGNLRDLLLAAPAGARPTMGLDPGLRTGVKVAVVDGTGKVVAHETIYPHVPRNQWDQSLATLAGLARAHGVELVAIGNGTASRETHKLAQELAKAAPGLIPAMVSEAGASVYSASEEASKELPELDVSIRGAVSIARRLQDPLAELVKIDPKSIGVGQYQHDVSATMLSRSLDGVVEDCVNAVGVDVNTASAPLLRRVSGISSGLATTIVGFRDEHGPFASRKALTKVPGLGAKAFEQCAGFLRIRGGDDPLDVGDVGGTVGHRWRSDADQADLAVRNRGGQVGRGPQGSAGDRLLQQGIQAWFDDRAAPGVERLDLPGVDVDTDDIVTAHSQTRGGDGADVAQAQDGDLHLAAPPSSSNSRPKASVAKPSVRS